MDDIEAIKRLKGRYCRTIDGSPQSGLPGENRLWRSAVSAYTSGSPGNVARPTKRPIVGPHRATDSAFPAQLPDEPTPYR
jgi:hypothetical protein